MPIPMPMPMPMPTPTPMPMPKPTPMPMPMPMSIRIRMRPPTPPSSVSQPDPPRPRTPLPRAMDSARARTRPRTRPRNKCAPNDLPLATIANSSPITAASAVASETSSVETNRRPTAYTDAFLDSCAQLAGYGDSFCDSQTYANTWLSQVRRRCSTIRNWLPKMCSCLETGTAFLGQSVGNYQRLNGKGNAFEFVGRSTSGTRTRPSSADRTDESEQEEEKPEEICFYCEDETSYEMTVERNLRTIDLCELLKAKRNAIGIDWSIVEVWPELGMERTLEDHEDVLAVYREMKVFSLERMRKFLFREDYPKYEFFCDPRELLPEERMNAPGTFAEDRDNLAEAESALRRCLTDDDVEWPQIFSSAWIQIGRLNVWRRVRLLLKDRKLYQAKKNNRQAYLLAHLSDYAVYKITNARKRFKAPFPWGICLRPTSTAEPQTIKSGEPGLKVIAFHSEKSRACWLTAMRLAKYGKQLRENYRAFKNKQCEQTENSKDRYVNYNVSNESVRSRVAMDFTGSVGRIVEDPKEAKYIAESEGINWRRTWRPFSRPPPGCAVVRLHGLDEGIHVLQPWFHRGLKRDIAAAIVRDYGSVDGVFLVRESKSNLGAYVLTYKYSDKVFHAQIQPVFDERCNCWLYTLDKGVTRFYDLLQLIEFYQLNAGCLPTRLTHYVQNEVPAMLPLPMALPQARPEENGGSSSPVELGRRLNGATGGNGSVACGAASAPASACSAEHKSIRG